MSQPGAKQSGYIPEFDGLRAIAIILVIVYHGFVGTRLGDSPLKYAHLPIGLGWSGVDLFFVLSGFLITRILLAAKGAEGYFKNFYARRLLRIFPLYYFYLLLTLLVLPLFMPELGQEQPVPAAWFWLYGSNIWTAVNGWPHMLHGHLWSLAVEEQFYLLWPVAVAFLSRRPLLAFLAMLIVGVPVARYFIMAGLPGDPVFNHVMLPTRIDTLAVGAALAVLLAGEVDRQVWGRRLWLLTGLGVLLFAVCFAAGGYPSLSSTRPLVHALLFTAMAFMYGGVIGGVHLCSRGSGMIPRLLRAGPMVAIGKVSYGIYVYHQAINFAMREAGWHPEAFAISGAPAFAFGMAYVAVLFALTYGLSWMSWSLLESPLLKLKKYFEYAPRTPSHRQR